MTRNKKIVVGLLLAVAALFVGATAFARGPGLHQRIWKRVVSAHVEEMLDAIDATPAQRTATHASVDKVLAAFSTAHSPGQHATELERALDLFAADKLDAHKIDALRAEREVEMKRIGDVVSGEVTSLNAQLTASQRQKLAAWVREHKPMRDGHRGGFMKKMVTAHIDEALDAIKATDAQRGVIDAARDHVFATFAEMHDGGGAQIEHALTLLETGKLDAAQIDALRAEHQSQQRKIGDAIVQALYDVHGTLSAPQRKALVEYVREHHPGPAGQHG
jgi:Spy/CpxP family protein refolding chaperone